MNRIIALLTDFGLSDAYVGTMKGVLLSICPAAHLVDLTHTIEPQNVRQAAYILLTAFRYFPPDTLFLAVVDPGVGTGREPIAVETDHGIYVGPDNGIFSYVLAQVQVKEAIVLQNPHYQLPGASHTFHGRDIFSPAVAHLANGVPITQFGPALSEWQRLSDPVLEVAPSGVRGEVLHIDHFGNVITSIGHLTWITPTTLRLTPQFGPNRAMPCEIDATTCQVMISAQTISVIRPAYGAAAPGSITPLVGSSGQLEIGANRGSAAQLLNITPGDPVILNY